MNISAPYETIIQHSDSFDMLLNNFQSFLFLRGAFDAGRKFCGRCKRIVMQPKWNDKAWLDLFTIV
jgi:hypothetical protein